MAASMPIMVVIKNQCNSAMLVFIVDYISVRSFVIYVCFYISDGLFVYILRINIIDVIKEIFVCILKYK